MQIQVPRRRKCPGICGTSFKGEIQGSTSIGTGFIYRYMIDKDKSIPVVITNKHVVMDGHETRLHFHMMDENQKIIDKKRVIVTVVDTKQNWIPHPDSHIDLCALPIANFHHIHTIPLIGHHRTTSVVPTMPFE